MPSSGPTRTTGSDVEVRNACQGGSDDIRTERVVATEVETTVDDDTDDRRQEATVETRDTVRGERLLVDVNEAVELAGTSTLRRLGVVGKTGTGVVERVHEEQRRRTSGTTGCEVTTEPLPVTVVLLETEERLEVVLCKACQFATSRD